MRLAAQLVSGVLFAIGVLLIIDALLPESRGGHPAGKEIMAAVGLLLAGLVLRLIKWRN
jgi:hypothetical protein